MNKKEFVKSIRAKLDKLGVVENGCYNLNLELIKGKRLSWVSHKQVMISVQIMGSLWKNRRYPIYSKEINYALLSIINKELEDVLNKC